MSNFTATSDNSGAKELWRGPWAGISRTNWILTNIDKSPKISDAKKTQYKGEAHFLRGLYYFNLVRLFGDVPWIDKQQTASDDLQVSRTSKDIVYQHIIDDFSDAASMLPAVYENTTDIGRATKGAAFGLLAKVYLTLKRYNETLVAIDSVMNLGVYSLNRKYEWNFSDLRENGPESLFEVQYEKDVTAYSEFDILGQGGWHHEYMAPLASINIGGPWGNFGWFAVYPEFVESYEPGDLRKSVSVWCEGDVYQGWSYDPTCSQTGHNVKKFLCENIGVDRAMDSPLNFPVLRFADVLLMQAEALNELGRSSEAAAGGIQHRRSLRGKRITTAFSLPPAAAFRERRRHFYTNTASTTSAIRFMCWLNKTKRLLANFPKTSALALGCLSVAALPPYYLLPLLAAAFGGLMFLLLASPSPKKAFAVGYWFGFGHFACGLFWINNALMMDLPRLGWLIPLCFAGSGGFFGLFAAFPALFCRFFKGNWPRLLAFAAAWTFFEWIRSFIFTGFPWNLLGTVWAFSDSAIQAAALFGTYGLSLFSV